MTKQSVGASRNGERVALHTSVTTCRAYHTTRPPQHCPSKSVMICKKHVVNAILRKMGITSNPPRAVVSVKARYGGIGLDHLTSVQSHGQLQHLLGHLQCQYTTGQLIHMTMKFTQMECSCMGNVLEQSYKQYVGAIIDEYWITAIWAHLERCEATVKVTGLWKPTHGREKDSAIMEKITASGRFKPAEIREINICRLYLQVFFTSDIADNSDKHLEPLVPKGQIQSTRNSIWEWPVQHRPTSWKLWKQAIMELFAQDGSMLQPLGHWYVEHHTQQECYLDARAQEIWHQTDNTWIRHQAQNIGRLRFNIQCTEGAEPLRHALTHVTTVTQRPRYVEVSAQTPIHTQHITQIMQLVPYVSSIGEASHALPIHLQSLVGDIGEFQTPRQWDVTKEVDLIIATDGSVLFGIGYHS
jgi:hypothetical protein